MKATRQGIGKLLDQPSPDTRFYLFWGPDEGQSRGHAARLLLTMGADRFIVISNSIKADPASLADEAGALALFGGRRVIWIEPAGDEVKEGIAALLEAPKIESPVVAIASSASKPRELIRMAESSPLAIAFASYVPEGKDAERMVIDAGRRVGLSIASPVAGRLAAACGNDQAIVGQEVEKLALYLDASTSRPKELAHEDVDAVGADLGDSDSLQLADLALSGDVEGTAIALARMTGAAEAIPILRSLQRRLATLAPARAKVESGDRPDAVMASMGKSLFWKDKAKFAGMLKRWSAADIATLAARLGATERTLVFSDAPPQELLGEELLAVARAARRR